MRDMTLMRLWKSTSLSERETKDLVFDRGLSYGLHWSLYGAGGFVEAVVLCSQTRRERLHVPNRSAILVDLPISLTVERDLTQSCHLASFVV